jgi:hypothetical protein
MKEWEWRQGVLACDDTVQGCDFRAVVIGLYIELRSGPCESSRLM